MLIVVKSSSQFGDRECPPLKIAAHMSEAFYSLSNTLGSDMVLQRAPSSAVIWGFGTPGVVIRTRFRAMVLESQERPLMETPRASRESVEGDDNADDDERGGRLARIWARVLGP